jgi:uncharacterized membrane protein YjgN (DUF898 family)
MGEIMDIENASPTAGFAGAPSDSASLPIVCTMQKRRALWIGFYTTLLNIVTLTIFRFWGRTQFRRALWAETRIGGEPIEYTGRGMELFVGFVIALFALTIPFIAVLALAQFFLDPVSAGIVIFVAYLFFFLLIGVALFLARRYHLSRTRYRGVRFAQTGSAWNYGLAVFGYGLLSAVTLGWYGPRARIKLSRALWSNAYYGSARFRFEDTQEALAEPVYKSFGIAWFGSLIVYVGMALLFGGQLAGLEESLLAGDYGAIAALYAGFFGGAILIGLCFAWHEAVITRRIVKSLGVDGLRFSSSFRALDVVELAITNTLIVIFTLGIGFMVAQARMWKRLANRMSLKGSIDFAAIRQTAEKAPKQGEGLADGFDLVSNF